MDVFFSDDAPPLVSVRDSSEAEFTIPQKRAAPIFAAFLWYPGFRLKRQAHAVY